jgi:putative transcriptional regulator
MSKTVIRWKLNEVMAQKRVRNKDLAQGIHITETSVYRLRRTDEMPRMNPERLNDICRYLNCQPGDLLVYEPDPKESDYAQATPSNSSYISEDAQSINSNVIDQANSKVIPLMLPFERKKTQGVS